MTIVARVAMESFFMVAKQLVFRGDARERIRRGVHALAAKSVELEDRFENMGHSLCVRSPKARSSTVDFFRRIASNAGDGPSIVLARVAAPNYPCDGPCTE